MQDGGVPRIVMKVPTWNMPEDTGEKQEKISEKNSRCLGRDSNLASLEYESWALPLRLHFSIAYCSNTLVHDVTELACLQPTNLTLIIYV